MRKKPASPGQALKWVSSEIPSSTDDCIIWPFGRFADGYGAVRILGKTQRAHRHVCRLVHGDPPSEAYDAAHTCGNGHLACVNDRHLYWATRAQNLMDRVAHGTMNRGERNGFAKLTEDQARAIFALKGSGLIQADVASRFGVSRRLVGNIWALRAWAWLHG